MKISKCPICNKKYKEYNALLIHIENEHNDIIENNGCISPSQLLFNIKYNKKSGSCIICKKNTQWNEKSGRYERICSEICKEKYRELFKNRMIGKYGKVHLLNNPDQQKKMLANRKISGKFQYGNYTFNYTGQYEKNFLNFLKVFMNWDPKDIIAPAPQIFHYKFDNKDRIYIPDFYLISINTIIEIKDGGNNPNLHPKIISIDKEKEKIKDFIMSHQTDFNYLKITNNNFNQFTKYLNDYKENLNSKDKKENLIYLNESNLLKLYINNIKENLINNKI